MDNLFNYKDQERNWYGAKEWLEHVFKTWNEITSKIPEACYLWELFVHKINIVIKYFTFKRSKMGYVRVHHNLWHDHLFYFFLLLVFKTLITRGFKNFHRRKQFAFEIKSFAAIRWFRIPGYIKECTFTAWNKHIS